MAQKGSKTIFFDIRANTKEAEADVKKLDGQVSKLKDESGQLVYKVRLEGENQLLQFDQLISKYNEKGENSLVVTFDQQATQASLGKTRKAIESGMQQIVEMIKKLMTNAGSIIGLDGIGDNLDNGLTSYTKKVAEAQSRINKEISKSKDKLKSEYKKDLAKSYEDYDNATFKKLYERMSQYRATTDIKKNGVKGKENYSWDDLKDNYDAIVRDISLTSDTKDFEEQLAQAGERISEKYSEVFNDIKTNYKELQSLLSGGFVSESDLDKIISGEKYDIKEVIKRATANKDNAIKYNESSNGSGDLENVGLSFTVTPENINTLRSTLQNGLKNINIEVDVDSSQIDKIRKKLDVGSDVNDFELKKSNKEIVDTYKNYKDKGYNTIADQITGIVSTYSKGRENEGKNLSKSDQKTLATLFNLYKQKRGYDKNRASLLEDAGIKNGDKFFGDLDKIQEQASSYMTAKDGGILVDVKLNPKYADGTDLKQQIEDQLTGITLTVDKIDGLKEAILSSVQDALLQSSEAVTSVIAGNKENQRVASEEELEQAKKIVNDTINGVSDGKDNTIKFNVEFSDDLEKAKNNINAIYKFISANKNDSKTTIAVKLKVDENSLKNLQGEISSKLASIQKNVDGKKIEIGLEAGKDSSLKPLLNAKKELETINIHGNIDNLEEMSSQLSNAFAKSITEAFSKIDLNTLFINNAKNESEDKKLISNISDNEIKQTNDNTLNNIKDNAEEATSSVDKLYNSLQKIIDASKSGDAKLQKSLVSDLEDSLNEEYFENKDLLHDSTFSSKIKSGYINELIGHVNEVYDADIPYIQEQAEQAAETFTSTFKDRILKTTKENAVQLSFDIDFDENKVEEKTKEIRDSIDKIVNSSNNTDNKQAIDDAKLIRIGDGGLDLGISQTENKFSKAYGSKKAKATKTDIKKYIEQYNNSVGKEQEDAFNALISGVGSYKDPDTLSKTFGSKNSDLYEEILDRVKKAKEVAKEYQEVQSEISKIADNINELSRDNFMTTGDVTNLQNIMKKNGATGAYDYLDGKFGTNLNNRQKNEVKTEEIVDEIKSDSKSSNGIPITFDASASIAEIKAQLTAIGSDPIPVTFEPGESIKKVNELLSSITSVSGVLSGENGELINEGAVNHLSEVSNKLNELSSSNIPSMGTAFTGAADTIVSQSDKIKDSIGSIRDVVNEIKDILSSAGFTEISHVENYQEELDNLEKQRDLLKKQQEDIEAAKKAATESVNQTLQAANEEANKIIEEANKKKQRILSKQEKEISNLKDQRDSYTTQSNSDSRNKELLLKAVDKTNGIDIEESSIKKLEDGTIQFTAEVKNANGEVEKLVYKYQQLSDIITKSGSLSKKFLKTGMTEEDIYKQSDEYKKKLEEEQKAQQEQQKLLEEQKKQSEILKQKQEEQKQVTDYVNSSSIVSNRSSKDNQLERELANKLWLNNSSKNENVTNVKTAISTVVDNINKDPLSLYSDKASVADIARLNSVADLIESIGKKAAEKIERIKEVSANTPFFELDEDSIKSIEDSIVFGGTINAGTLKAENYKFSLDDVDSFLKKDKDEWNLTNLKKTGISEKELIRNQQIEDAKEARKQAIKDAKDDIDSIDVSKLTEKQKMIKDALADILEMREYNANKEENEPAMKLNADELKAQKEALYALFEIAKETSHEFDDIEISSANFSDKGFVSLQSSIKSANGELQSLNVEFKDLTEMVDTKTLSLDRFKFNENSSNTSFGSKNGSNEEILQTKQQLIDSINKQRIYNSTLNLDSEETSEKKNAEFLQEQVTLSQKLVELTNQRKMSSDEVAKIDADIFEQTQSQLNLLTKEDFSGEAQKRLSKLATDFNSLFAGLDTKEGISNNFIDKIVDIDGQKANLIQGLDDLRNEILKYFNNIFNGSFENKSALNDYINGTVAKKLTTAKGLIKDSRNTYKNQIGDLFDLNGKSDSDITQLIRKYYEETYGKNGLSVSPFNRKDGSIVEYVDDGTLKRQKVTLDSYTVGLNNAAKAQQNLADASNTAKEAVDGEGEKISQETSKINSANAESSDNEVTKQMGIFRGTTPRNVRKYQTAGEKWIDGVKAKVANLTQYVTGIDIVMRGWNEIQQGFSFIKEFDSALKTINQTMSTTQEELSNLGKGSIEAGKQLGSTADSVLDAAAIYANANETAESVLEKAKPTVLLSNASGLDTSESADMIQGVK